MRLRFLASINPATPEFDALDDDASLPFVPLEAVWPSGLDSSRRKSRVEVSTGYTRFREGDIVVPKITPTFQADRTAVATGIEGGVAAGTTELHIVRVGRRVDSRYVRYLFSSRPFLQGGEASMIGVAGQKRVPDDWLRDTDVPITDVAHQRAIADYLDAETARIDALVAKKRRLVEVLEERSWLAFESALRRRGIDVPSTLEHDEIARTIVAPGWRVLKLSSLLRQLTNGYVGPTRDILQDDGVRYIQGLHVKGDVVDFDRHPFFVDEAWHRARPRTSLLTGDIVIVQTGDIGKVAVIPPGFGEANCHALLIARVNTDLVSSEYLGAFLQSHFGYHSLLRVATGALHPHLEFGIRDVPVLLAPVEDQSEIAAEVSNERSRSGQAQRAIRRQITLLQEHRQALITAAVTGELAVPGVVG